MCVVVAILLSVAGCATSRGVVDIRIPVTLASAAARTVKLVEVLDNRSFQRKPSDPSIPSLKGAEIQDRAITSRAVARKRNSYGKALGDILLPEGRTVEALVTDALTAAFSEAGYRVVQRDEAGYEEATAVTADIEQFWAWFSPGFWAAHLEFEARVRLKGEVAGLEKQPVIRGYIRLATQAATTRAWQNTIYGGIEDFIAKLKATLLSGS
jgi:hypothetical protein